MRHPLIVTTVAGAVLAAGLLAGPALAHAAAPAGTSVTATTSTGAGYGRGPGGGGGVGGGGSTSTGLTPDQKARLAGLAEEEKLAHDVYVRLGARTGDLRFSRISTAETRHHSQIQMLLTRYGVADPTAGKAEGEFASPAVQALYTELVSRGSVSLDAALAVGRDIETLDIADLAAASQGVTAVDVLTVYERLSQGSQNHLQAFGG